MSERPEPQLAVPPALSESQRERYLIHLIAVFDAVRSSELDKQLKTVGLSIAKDRTLGWLSVVPGSSMTDLARGTYIDRTTLTRVVDQLVADGHVGRETSPADRRKVLLWLRPSGKEQVKVGAKVTDAVNEMIGGVLDGEAIDATIRAVQALVRSAIADKDIRAVLTGRAERAPSS